MDLCPGYPSTQDLVRSYVDGSRSAPDVVAQLGARGHLWALAYELGLCETCWKPIIGGDCPDGCFARNVRHVLETAPVR